MAGGFFSALDTTLDAAMKYRSEPSQHVSFRRNLEKFFLIISRSSGNLRVDVRLRKDSRSTHGDMPLRQTNILASFISQKLGLTD